MKSFATEQLRNVGLFSHGGAGKTTLSEAVLFTAGAISRLGRVDDGTTTSDFDPDETKRKISVNTSILPLEWKDRKINILDTPGYADFVGEVKEAMRVVDSAIVLVDAVAGVEVGTDLVWQYANERGVPRMILVNRIDRENADFRRAVEQVQQRFGKQCVPIQLPIGSQESFSGVIDLVQMKAVAAQKGETSAIPDAMKADAEALRDKFVEAVAETDDELIMKYLEGEELTQQEIESALRAAINAGKLVPIVVASGMASKGISTLLDAIVNYLPSPIDRGPTKAKEAASDKEVEIESSATAPVAALVFKTTADPYVGKLTYLRVYTGTLLSDSHAFNANKGKEERIGQLFTIRGKAQEPTSQIIAGDFGAVAKLVETTTGDTLSSKDRPLILEPINFPAPLFSASIQPKTKADLDKLGSSLSRLVEEDPTLSVRKEPDTGETLLSGMGESHVEVSAEKMKRKFGVDVKITTPKVPYKETITVQTKAEYKHKKQTGGHGQYGHVFLELEPMPRGSGAQFAEKVVGGVVPRNFIPAVEKGVNEALPEGVVAHFPVTDVKVTLYDGSYHPVDSSEMAFKIAASQAFKKGVNQAHPVLLEPVMNIKVTVPDNYTGDIMSDLNSKRARVQGMNPQDGLSVIEAQAPLAEIQRYATDLRSITQGRGVFTMEFSHYEEVPAHIAQGIIAEAKKEADKE